MKIPHVAMISIVLLSVPGLAGSVRRGSAALAQKYGPGRCVSVARSPSTGSCILRTHCQGQDTSRFDFQFVCVDSSGRKTHSLGVGSFEENEEFDTEVQCQQCLSPTLAAGRPLALAQLPAGSRPAVPAHSAPGHDLPGHGLPAPRANNTVSSQAMHAPPAAPEHLESNHTAAYHPPRPWIHSVLQLSASEPEAQEAQAQVAADKSGNASAVSMPTGKVETYGPSMCVSTWRDEESGFCVVQTECLPGTDLSNYNFGFICDQEDGGITRHLYGKDSFEIKETYLTDVPCTRCLGLEDKPMRSIDTVSALVKQVAALKEQLLNISGALSKLQEEQATTPAPPAATAAPPVAPPPPPPPAAAQPPPPPPQTPPPYAPPPAQPAQPQPPTGLSPAGLLSKAAPQVHHTGSLLASGLPAVQTASGDQEELEGEPETEPQAEELGGDLGGDAEELRQGEGDAEGDDGMQ